MFTIAFVGLVPRARGRSLDRSEPLVVVYPDTMLIFAKPSSTLLTPYREDVEELEDTVELREAAMEFVL